MSRIGSNGGMVVVDVVGGGSCIGSDEYRSSRST